MRNLIRDYRQYLSNYDSLLAYSVLGLVGGIASGVVILAFELAITEVAALWGVGDRGDGFEALPQYMHFLLPALGALANGSHPPPPICSTPNSVLAPISGDEQESSPNNSSISTGLEGDTSLGSHSSSVQSSAAAAVAAAAATADMLLENSKCLFALF